MIVDAAGRQAAPAAAKLVVAGAARVAAGAEVAAWANDGQAVPAARAITAAATARTRNLPNHRIAASMLPTPSSLPVGGPDRPTSCCLGRLTMPHPVSSWLAHAR